MTKCWRIVNCYGEPSEMKFALNVEQAATIIENIDTKTHEYMPAGQMEFILPYSNTQSNYLFIEQLGAPFMIYPFIEHASNAIYHRMTSLYLTLIFSHCIYSHKSVFFHIFMSVAQLPRAPKLTTNECSLHYVSTVH